MFLNRDYRARAIGLAVAYAVVITGLIIGAALDSPPAKSASQPIQQSAERQPGKTAHDSAAGVVKRCDTVC
jgi:hypothetical protein